MAALRQPFERARLTAFIDVIATAHQIQMCGKDLSGWLAYLLSFPSRANFEVPVQYPKAKALAMQVMKAGCVIET